MEIKRETSYVKNIKCSDVYTESITDYSLPDYLGDVRKILFTEAVLRPSGRFAGGDEVEFSGVVVYNVIYLDADNKLSSVEFTSDYEYSVKCSAEDYKDSVSDTRISNYSVRLSGPRRFSVRATLVGSGSISENATVCISGNSFDSDSSLEVNQRTVRVRNCSVSSVLEREYAEQMTNIDGAIADELKVIYSSAEAFCESVSIDGDGVSITGKVNLLAVIQNGDETAYKLCKTVAIEERVEFEGVSEDTRLSPRLTVSSRKTNVNPTETGCEIVMSCIIELCVVGERNDNVDLTLDCYLKDAATENSYDDFGYLSLVDQAFTKGIHTAEYDRSELEAETLHEVIMMSAIPKVERVELSDGVVNIFGEIRYCGIASETNGEGDTYTSLKFTSPFETNVNVCCQNSEKITVDARVCCHSASASLDAEKIYPFCTLESFVTLSESKSEKILSSSSVCEGEESGSRQAKISVYYPSAGDTLFSVAKRFKTSGLKIARDNDISEQVFAPDNEGGSLAEIKKLLIY